MIQCSKKPLMAPCISVSEILLLLLVVSVFARVCVCVWGGGGRELKTFTPNSLPCLNLKIEITFFSLERFLYLWIVLQNGYFSGRVKWNVSVFNSKEPIRNTWWNIGAFFGTMVFSEEWSSSSKLITFPLKTLTPGQYVSSTSSSNTGMASRLWK